MKMWLRARSEYNQSVPYLRSSIADNRTCVVWRCSEVNVGGTIEQKNGDLQADLDLILTQRYTFGTAMNRRRLAGCTFSGDKIRSSAAAP
jgi:hypothetical protein